jgi:hypothetical protein
VCAAVPKHYLQGPDGRHFRHQALAFGYPQPAASAKIQRHPSASLLPISSAAETKPIKNTPSPCGLVHRTVSSACGVKSLLLPGFLLPQAEETFFSDTFQRSLFPA